MQRNMLTFENAIKFKASRKTYLYSLNKLMTFFNVKDHDVLASLHQEKQIMMEDYMMHLKNTVCCKP